MKAIKKEAAWKQFQKTGSVQTKSLCLPISRHRIKPTFSKDSLSVSLILGLSPWLSLCQSFEPVVTESFCFHIGLLTGLLSFVSVCKISDRDEPVHGHRKFNFKPDNWLLIW